jgi:GMP synthase-like glutamine amidotransferase
MMLISNREDTAAKKRHIGILKTGSAPSGLIATQGDYDDCFRSLLGIDLFTFRTYDVEHNVFPGSAIAADGWIITGSRHGVYDCHPWIAPLERLIRNIQLAQRPLVGICFGHQIVAQALGGRVERATDWIAGPQTYRDLHGTEFVANAWHRDQVVSAPPSATVLASGEGCPIAGLWYPGPILTLQPHPEFDSSYLRGLCEERGSVLQPNQQARVSALAAMCAPSYTYLIPLLTTILQSRTSSIGTTPIAAAADTS